MLLALGVRRGGSVVARIRAAWLSSNIVEILLFGSNGRSNFVQISSCTRRRNRRDFIAADAAMYSDSIVWRAVMVCSFDCQKTGLSPRQMTNPVRECEKEGCVCE